MTRSSKQNLFLAVTILCVLLAPSVAFAGGKGGGGNHADNNRPSENMTLNYGKVEHTYTQQSASKKSGTGSGKVKFHDLSITKKTDKASP